MTVREFSNEFDILYDSIASMSAPALDEYEKSVFLTKAQLEIIKEYLGPINKYKQSFEASTKRRADLRELILQFSTTPAKISNGLSEESYSADLPGDLFLVVHEQGTYIKQGCTAESTMSITPIKYDEITDTLRNPFRRPTKGKGIRIDIASKDNKKIVELIASETILSYSIRYIKYPTPIVLTDLGQVSTAALSIDGVSEKTECTLDQEVHREILDRAVELAMLAYKPEGLSAQVQLDQRNN